MEKLYRCGDCPVCSLMGDLILLEALDSRILFVSCPSCGCAFDRPKDEVDEIAVPVSVAPRGFILPDREGVRVALDRDWRPRFLARLDDEWHDLLGPRFRPTDAQRRE